MKQKHFYLFLLLTITVVLVFLGCTKQGPAGATGPQGPQGATGPTGPGGSKGDTGTANVIYSQWDSSFAGTAAAWNVPLLTQGILDSGLTNVYFRTIGSNFVEQLNYSVGNFVLTYFTTVPDIAIVYSGTDPTFNLKNYAFRYIIIPGGLPSGNSIPKDYKSLCKQYNISD
jgi:hypothetical protein